MKRIFSATVFNTLAITDAFAMRGGGSGDAGGYIVIAVCLLTGYIGSRYIGKKGGVLIGLISFPIALKFADEIAALLGIIFICWILHGVFFGESDSEKISRRKPDHGKNDQKIGLTKKDGDKRR